MPLPLKRTAFATLAALALTTPAGADSYQDIVPIERRYTYIKAEDVKWGTLVHKLGLQGSQ